MARKPKTKTDETINNISGNPPEPDTTPGDEGGEILKPLEIVVRREQVDKRHFIMLGRSDDGKFTTVEAWNESETIAFGAKSIAEILSATGVDLDNEEFAITFSPNTGEVIAATAVKRSQ